MCLYLGPSWVFFIRSLQDDWVVGEIASRGGATVKEFDGFTSVQPDLRGVSLEDMETANCVERHHETDLALCHPALDLCNISGQGCVVHETTDDVLFCHFVVAVSNKIESSGCMLC